MRIQLIGQLEKTLNQYLMLDPESSDRLQTLHGKIVQLQLEGPAIDLQFLFSEGRIHLKTTDFDAPHVLIKGQPISLFHLLITKDRRLFFKEHLTMEGDLDLAQKTIELFDTLEIDWEEHLSHWIGDISSHKIGQWVRHFKRSRRSFRESLIENINEYIHEEINLFPTRQALEGLFQDIDTLRMDTDRLGKRLDLLIVSLEKTL